jgi:hypothetical protein
VQASRMMNAGSYFSSADQGYGTIKAEKGK